MKVCVWCGGSMLPDDGELKCFACGRGEHYGESQSLVAEREQEPDANPNYIRRYYLAHVRSIAERKRVWFQANKERILRHQLAYCREKRAKAKAVNVRVRERINSGAV